MVVIQRDGAALALTVASGTDGRRSVRLSRFDDSGRSLLSEEPMAGTDVLLKVVGNYLSYSFQFSVDGKQWSRVGPVVDGTLLSPAVLHGFNYTGVFVGLYASANGLPTSNHADFAWFQYEATAQNRDAWYRRIRTPGPK